MLQIKEVCFMKIIIHENERGFLYKDGIFQRMLPPGKHKVRKFLGENIHNVSIVGRTAIILNPTNMPQMNLDTMLNDKLFKESIVVIEVPESNYAAHFVDGYISGLLKPGKYVFWNIYHKHTFKLYDRTQPESINEMPVEYIRYASGLHSYIDVGAGSVALLFFNGKFERLLESGRYFFWNHNVNVTYKAVDTRLQQLEITGQEILTADKIGVRLNFTCSYKVVEPVKIFTDIQDYQQQVKSLVQLSLRAFVGKFRLDELLRQKDNIGDFVLEKLKEKESELFVCFSYAGVKDIILPGEIRDIMNTVLIAEKAAQASVITRREETAETKSLLDTAKLMDENDTLYKLKELEYLERICDKIKSISVDSSGGILKSLRELVK
jgi:regulator of protease activity HflC (stomatin/prohibitin superfamily)